MEILFSPTINQDYKKLVARLYSKKEATVLFEHYFTALSHLNDKRYKNQTISLYVNKKIIGHGLIQVIDDFCYVGFVELENSSQIAKVMFDQIKSYVLKKYPNVRRIFLPVNLTIWHNYRFLKDSKIDLPFQLPQNSYYAKIFNRVLKHKETFSSYLKVLPKHPKPIILKDFSIRKVELSNLPRELKIIYRLSVEIFKSEHVAPTLAKFMKIYESVQIDPNYLLIAEINKKPIGFCFSFKRADTVYIKTLGILEKFRRRGIGKALYQSIVNQSLRDGCSHACYVTIKDKRLITLLLPRGTKRVASYVLYNQILK